MTKQKVEIKYIILTVILTVTAERFFNVINWAKALEQPNIMAYLAVIGSMFLFYILMITALAYTLFKIVNKLEF